MDDAALQGLEVGPRASLDAEVVAVASHRYDLGVVLDVRDIGGMYNLNAQVRTSSGAFVIRVHRPWVKPERLSMLHNLRSALFADGFPVARPVTSFTGSTFTTFGDRLLEVEHFVESDGETDSWERYEAAFALLGRLHDFLFTWFERKTFVFPRWSNYAPPDTLVRWMGKTTERVERERIESAGIGLEFGTAVRLCDDALNVLRLVEGWWSSNGSSLPGRPIHGDYGGGNVLFENEAIKLVVDFDFLSIRERVYELAYSLYWMLRRLEGDQPPESLSWIRLREMLHAYNASTSRPLDARELAALPMQMARVAVHWVAEAWLTEDPLRNVVAQEPGVEVARWLTRQEKKVTALLHP